MRRRVVAVGLLALLVVMDARAERLAVGGSTGVTIIDLATGRSVASTPVEGGVTRLLANGDGSRLVAISRGPGSSNWLGTFKPKGKASVAVIDGATMKVLRQSELGWDASDAQITPDGRSVVILSPGSGTKPSSIHLIDLGTGEVVSSAEMVGYRASALLLTGADQAVAYVASAAKTAPTLLRFLDLASLKVTSEIRIEGRTLAPAAFENHDLIYLLAGSGFRPATLSVVSSSQQKLIGSHQVGEIASIGAFDPATSRLFVLNQSSQRGKRGFNGRIDIFRNGEPEHALKTVDIPKKMVFTPDRKKAFIYTSREMSVLHLDTFEQPGKPEWVGIPHSTYFTPDQKRALFYFASAEGCCAAGVLDMESGKLLKTFAVGGRGARIADALLAVAATAASFSSAQSAAKQSGASSFHYTVYTPRPSTVGSGPLTIHPDGKFAYAVDSNSNRLTTIDLELGDRQKADIDITAGARELVPLRDGAVLAVMGEKGLTFVDPAARSVLSAHHFPGALRRVETTADDRAIAIAEGRIAVFDSAGKLLVENTTVAQPNDWILMQ